MTPRVDFTNILRAAFTHTNPKSAKKDSQVKQPFALLGYVSVKTAYKHVDEIDTKCTLCTFHELFIGKFTDINSKISV